MTNAKRLAAIILILLGAPSGAANHTFGPKNYCEDPSEWGLHAYWSGNTINEKAVGIGPIPLAGGAFDSNRSGDCNGDTIPGDYDGHFEWGIGIALLTVAPEDPSFPGCAVEVPHHIDGTIHVEDAFLGFGITFWVAADHDCDNISDTSIKCVGWCDPPFPSGADGTFYVFLATPATIGDVWTA